MNYIEYLVVDGTDDETQDAEDEEEIITLELGRHHESSCSSIYTNLF